MSTFPFSDAPRWSFSSHSPPGPRSTGLRSFWLSRQAGIADVGADQLSGDPSVCSFNSSRQPLAASFLGGLRSPNAMSIESDEAELSSASSAFTAHGQAFYSFTLRRPVEPSREPLELPRPGKVEMGSREKSVTMAELSVAGGRGRPRWRWRWRCHALPSPERGSGGLRLVMARTRTRMRLRGESEAGSLVEAS